MTACWYTWATCIAGRPDGEQESWFAQPVRFPTPMIENLFVEPHPLESSVAAVSSHIKLAIDENQYYEGRMKKVKLDLDYICEYADQLVIKLQKAVEDAQESLSKAIEHQTLVHGARGYQDSSIVLCNRSKIILSGILNGLPIVETNNEIRIRNNVRFYFIEVSDAPDSQHAA